MGTEPVLGGPGCRALSRRRVTLVVSEDEAPAAGADVASSPSPGSRSRMSTGAALELTLDAVGSGGPIAADLHALPGSLVAALGPGRLRDVRRALQDARAVKDPDEIEAIRAATEIADAGQAAARAGLRPGTDELELWTETRAAIEDLARRASRCWPTS